MQSGSGQPKRGLWGAAGIVAGATFLSRILGLAREQVFAYFFGAGLFTDAFQIAFRIPNLLRDLFAEGAMSSALVPVYTKTLQTKGESAGWDLARNAITALALVTVAVAIVGIFFSDALVHIYAPAFSLNPEKHALTVSLTRWLWPFFPFVVLAALWMGLLNARERFTVPALAPTLFNVASILAAFTLCPLISRLFGYPAIYGMAAGALIGGFLQWFVQVPVLRREGFSYGWRLNWRDPELRRICTMMSLGTFALAATQINILVNSIFASAQGDGAVSWLGYAFRLMQFPIGVFGVAISTVTLTKVSREAAGADLRAVANTVVDSLRMVFVLTVPSAVGLAVLAVPIISVIYEHGRFTAFDTQATAAALVFYSVGLTAYSGVRVLVPVFYSLNKPTLPILSSGFAVLVNIALCYLFSRNLGFAGLALATSCSALANFLILLFILLWSLPDFRWGNLLDCALRVGGASAAMAGALWFFLRKTAPAWEAGGFWNRLLVLGFGLILGVAVYGLCAKVLSLDEVKKFTSALRRKLFRQGSL